jgi:hypothetical protein
MEAKRLVGAQKQREITKKKRSGKPFEKGNPHAFKLGQSGNPGGLPKGTPKVKVALMDLLGLEPERLKTFKPSTVAEELAFKQVKRALGWNDTPVKDAILATEKIADRTEGRPTQRQEITGKDGKPLIDEQERAKAAIELLMERIGCSREVAAKELAPFMPEVNALMS